MGVQCITHTHKHINHQHSLKMPPLNKPINTYYQPIYTGGLLLPDAAGCINEKAVMPDAALEVGAQEGMCAAQGKNGKSGGGGGGG